MRYTYHKWMAKLYQKLKRHMERKFEDHFWRMVQVTQDERRDI